MEAAKSEPNTHIICTVVSLCYVYGHVICVYFMHEDSYKFMLVFPCKEKVLQSELSRLTVNHVEFGNVIFLCVKIFFKITLNSFRLCKLHFLNHIYEITYSGNKKYEK
jgi:hypothetical protein